MIMITPPWPDPAIEGLVHVGEELVSLPHCLLLLGGVNLFDNDDKYSNDDLYIYFVII